MSTSHNEISPTAWSHPRDVPFFSITSRLFSPQFCLGASVLLATYDDKAVTRRAVLTGSSSVSAAPEY